MFFAGLFVGKSCFNKSDKIPGIDKIEVTSKTGELVKGNVSSDKVKPVSVNIPTMKEIKFYHDTIRLDSVRYIVQKVDSLEILRDWLTTRHYDLVIFDNDSIGKCEIFADTQFNKLSNVHYEYTPIIKQVVVIPKNKTKYSLIGGLGLNTGGYINFQLGGFKNKWGVTYQFSQKLNKNECFYGINVLYKIGL